MRPTVRLTLASIFALFGFGLFAACGGDDGGDSRVEPTVLAGKVELTDSPDDASGVTVTVGDVSAKTSQDGAFELANVGQGERTLTADKDGYKPVSKTVKITGEGRTELGEPVTLSPQNQDPEIDLFTVSNDELDPEGTAEVEVRASDPNTPDEELTYDFSATGPFAIDSASAEEGTATVAAPDEFAARGDVRVTVKDGEGGEAEGRRELQTTGNRAPTINDLRASRTELSKSGTASLTVVASDPDGDELSYTWSAPGDWSVSSPDSLRTEVTAPDDYEESGEIEVEVEDTFGETARATVTLRTKENGAPTIQSVSATPPQVQPDGTIGLSVRANDPEDETLSYQWDAPQKWTVGSPKARTTEVSAPDSYAESAEVGVTVEDASGATSEGRVRVSTTTNDGPRITGLSTSSSTVESGGMLTAEVSATDPNGDDLSYTWTVDGTNWSVTKDANDPTRAEVTAAPTPGSSATVRVEVTDGTQASAKATATVSTAPNNAPTIGSLTATKTRVERDGQTTVTAVASDPDGDGLTYSWDAGGDWTIESGKGTASIDVGAPSPYGDVGLISVEVTDDHGAAATRQIVVRTEANERPNVQELTIGDDPIARGGTSTAVVRASDPKGDSLNYDWSINGTATWSVSKSSSRPSVATVDAPRDPDTNATLEVEVSDGFGASRTESLLVRTAPNEEPVVSEPASDLSVGDPDNPSPISHSRPFSWQVQAMDPDGDSLTYSLNTQTGASIDKNGEITWAPKASDKGTASVEIVVDDGHSTVKRTVKLEVGDFGLKSATDRSDMREKRSGMDFGDLNGDGRMDVVYVQRNHNWSADIEVAFGTSEGFDVQGVSNWDSSAQDCASPDIADVDADNDMDVFVFCREFGNQDQDDFYWYVWKNDGSGNFSKGERRRTNVDQGYNAKDVELGELDGDGVPEAVMVGGESLVIADNNGSGQFNQSDEWHNHDYRWYQVELANFDTSDTELEIATTYFDQDCCNEYSYVEVRDIGSGPDIDSQPYRDRITTNTYQQNPYGLGVGDWDGDGSPGLATMEAQENRLEVHRNQGGNWSPTATERIDTVPRAYRSQPITSADLNGDGNMDLIYAERQNGEFSMALGKGDGTFSTWTTNDIPNWANDITGVATTDWNGDKSTDVVFANHSGEIGVAY